jgi:hypothetical protein
VGDQSSDGLSDWLDALEPAAPAKTAPPAPAAPTATADDWLDIEDVHAHEISPAMRSLVNSCMPGTDRVMACDGQYLAYRPDNYVTGKATNPRTRERFAMFCEKGLYRHVGTWNDVQIFELMPGNPYRHEKKAYVVGKNLRDDIDKVARAALERQWADYHDLLGAMATAMKKGRDPGFARQLWGDTLNHIAVRIKQLGGPEAPSEREINEGFVGIRRARGITGKGGVIATLDSSSLPTVAFK